MYNISIRCILFSTIVCGLVVLCYFAPFAPFMPSIIACNTSRQESVESVETFQSLTQHHDTVNNPHLYLLDGGLPLPKNPNIDTFQFQGNRYNRTDMSSVLKNHNVIDGIIKAPGSHLYTQQHLIDLTDLPDFIATKLSQKASE